MGYKLTGYRWYAGTVSAATVTPAYDVAHFTVQSDQTGTAHRAWRVQPGKRANVVLPGGMQQALDGTQKVYSGYQVAWSFPYMTPLMVQWLFVNKFSSAYNAAATIRLWNKQVGAWEYYQATALWPSPAIWSKLETIGGGWVNTPIRFIEGTKL
jgi:hypothetical protein